MEAYFYTWVMTNKYIDSNDDIRHFNEIISLTSNF